MNLKKNNEDVAKNIFVTQFSEKEDENFLQDHIVKETPETLLKTGLNTFQETLIVDKEKELSNVDQELLNKRRNYESKMSRYQKKRQELIARQETFFDQMKTFETFIQENNAKKRRALSKYQCEIRLLELQNHILRELQQDIEKTKILHDKLLKRVKRNKMYENFLIQSVECLPQDYIKVTDNVLGGLIMRYNTLFSTNESLVSDMISKSEEGNNYSKILLEMKQNHENVILQSNYRLSLMYEKHERLRDESERLEQNFRLKHGDLRQEILQFGLTLRSIDNITKKCARKFDSSVADSDLESKIEKIQMDFKLNKIKDYIMTSKEIIDVVQQMKDDKLPQIPSKAVLTSVIEVPHNRKGYNNSGIKSK